MKLAIFLSMMTLGGVGWTAASHAQSTASPPSPSANATPDVPSEAMTAARANKTRMKIQPQFLAGPTAALPESEKLAGHNGTAVVSGIVDAFGNFVELRLRQSTGAPVLDQIALEAAKTTRFSAAKDAAGLPIAVPVSMPFEFYASQSQAAGGGLIHYTCDQFVRDTDWWRSTHPAAKWNEYKLYTFMVGFWVLYGPGNSIDDRLTGSNPMATQWPRWIESCRANPGQLFVDQTGPLAKTAHALAESLQTRGK